MFPRTIEHVNVKGLLLWLLRSGKVRNHACTAGGWGFLVFCKYSSSVIMQLRDGHREFVYECCIVYVIYARGTAEKSDAEKDVDIQTRVSWLEGIAFDYIPNGRPTCAFPQKRFNIFFFSFFFGRVSCRLPR